MEIIPDYWKTTLEDIEASIKLVRRGRVSTLCWTPGGRSVYQIFYGRENNLHRTANRSSALGAADESCYADRSAADYRPTVLLAGCIHGGEFEGTAALLNLISLLETGADIAGQPLPELRELAEQVNWVILPCANPDGRSHVPFASMVGKTFEELRYYNQGTWLDGTLCGWPDCKKVHPIKGKVGYLGGYFNDDGVNLMHDDFFGGMAAETNALLRAAEHYAPDFAALLHGGTNCVNQMLHPAYAPTSVKRSIARLEDDLLARCSRAGLPYECTPEDYAEEQTPPPSFNLISAMYHLCGAPCVTYESNQGLDSEGERLNYAEIYQEHIILLEAICSHVLREREKTGGDEN